MRTQLHSVVYLHMGKFSPGSDQMHILVLQIHTTGRVNLLFYCERKVNLPMGIFISSQNSAFRYQLFTFLFISDYMTIAETVDICC